MIRQRFYLLLLGLFVSLHLSAQPLEQTVKVLVAPSKVDWTYQVGEKVKFVISVFQNGNPLTNVDVRYEIGPEKLTPTEKGTKKATNGSLTLETAGAKTPGFIRCSAWVIVDGKEYRGFATAGFSPEKIQPTVQDPKDFDAYWNDAIQELAKSPLDARLTLLPERCTEKVDVYHVNLQNVRGARLYGILCKPKKPGKYPALLHVPGAGVRGYYGDVANAEKGMITLQIGIHGIPVNMDPSVYQDLAKGPLHQYMTFNLDSKDNFYFRRVFLGCIRANDFLTSLPEFDGTNLAVTGGSQGGALSIVTAALDKRVKMLAALYPAYSDVTGYLHNRAGGWPHYFLGANATTHNTPAKLQTIGYFDVVNFARRVQVPGFYTWGFNDETCPPTSMYASYNVIPGQKELFLALDTGHWTYPEQREKLTDWLTKRLLK
jgi:cephalosporin-C deacetylase-like acetyl esterase